MQETCTQEQAGFLVLGRVQGVGFRWWTCITAERLGLSGTVANRADGTVEVHVVGPPDAVGRMAAALGEGPSLAVVRRVQRIPSTRALRPGFTIVG